MAEAIARQTAKDVIDAESAGLAPLGHVAEMTRRVLVAQGYSAEGLASKPIAQKAWDEADLIINMSGQPREMAFRKFDKVEDWDVEDPYGENAEVYQRILLEIEKRVGELAERMRKKGGKQARK